MILKNYLLTLIMKVKLSKFLIKQKQKKENIKNILIELQKYKKNIEKEKYGQTNNSLLNKKLNNVIATLNFIEEIQFAKETIFENLFIFDWQEMKENQLTTNVVPFSTLTQEVNDAENNQQLTTSQHQNKFINVNY